MYDRGAGLVEYAEAERPLRRLVEVLEREEAAERRLPDAMVEEASGHDPDAWLDPLRAVWARSGHR